MVVIESILHTCEKWLRGNAFGEVTQGKCPAGKGKVRRTNYIATRSEYLAAAPLNTKLVPLNNFAAAHPPSGVARSP